LGESQTQIGQLPSQVLRLNPYGRFRRLPGTITHSF
jgi:hypothetical protein